MIKLLDTTNAKANQPKSLNAPVSSKVRELRGLKYSLGLDGDDYKCVECKAIMGSPEHFKYVLLLDRTYYWHVLLQNDACSVYTLFWQKINAIFVHFCTTQEICRVFDVQIRDNLQPQLRQSHDGFPLR